MAGEPRKYSSDTAFRRALEDRLKRIAVAEKLDFQRLMREAAFDRLLARLFAKPDAPWVLKGGYALELRIKEARVTRDIDLTLRQALGEERGSAQKDAIFEALRDAADLDLGDYFSYSVEPAMAELTGAPYGGARYPFEARLDGRSFVKFHVDVGAGDVVLEPLDTTKGHDWLGFAGIPPGRFPTISKEQHFAEKLHAYTLPRQTPNSRVRDLVDIVLLIQCGLDKKKVSADIAATFKRRKTHAVPAKLEPPPAAWEKPFAELARECGLSEEINDAFSVLDDFFKRLSFRNADD